MCYFHMWDCSSICHLNQSKSCPEGWSHLLILCKVATLEFPSNKEHRNFLSRLTAWVRSVICRKISWYIILGFCSDVKSSFIATNTPPPPENLHVFMIIVNCMHVLGILQMNNNRQGQGGLHNPQQYLHHCLQLMLPMMLFYDNFSNYSS